MCSCGLLPSSYCEPFYNLIVQKVGTVVLSSLKVCMDILAVPCFVLVDSGVCQYIIE